MKDKEVVIVIPGAKYLKSRSRLMQSMILFFYRTTKILKPVYKNYSKEWVHKFDKEGRKVVWLRWNRGFTIWSRWLGTFRLKKEIVKYYKKGYKIKLVGISLGGDIALRTLRSLGSEYIDNIVLICSATTNREVIEDVKIFNIYSPNDLFLELAIKVLAPIHGGMVLEGKEVENVCINDFNHDDFCNDNLIKDGEYEGKRITDITKDFLD